MPNQPLADHQGRTPVNLMTIREKKWWSDGVQSPLILDTEHIAECGADYQVFLHDTKARKLLGILRRWKIDDVEVEREIAFTTFGFA